MISGWGLNPKTLTEKVSLSSNLTWQDSFIPKGNLRSYGDSAIASKHIDMLANDNIISFNTKDGVITAEAGVLIEQIINISLPKGWFPHVVPGTKYVTLGGAIASDIHGKNHHKDGCFSNFVESITLQISNNLIIKCSGKENVELFRATCGGMGLTGVILEVELKLKKINSSQITQKIYKTSNLKETFHIFENNADSDYSVAWIDSLQKGKKIGRSLIMTGSFCDDGKLEIVKKKSINVPFMLPSFILNSWFIKIFNFIYYNKISKKVTLETTNYENFFFPLDSIKNWNRIYGKKGFFQFQFILPKSVSFEGINHILKVLADKNTGSFLAVLKLYGCENNNLLSFPMEGYSLALDFKRSKQNINLMSELTDYVISLNGRIYLTKDSILTKGQFANSYSKLGKFRALRTKFNLNKNFNSNQSLRLGI